MKKNILLTLIFFLSIAGMLSFYFVRNQPKNSFNQYISLYSSYSNQGTSAVPQLQTAVTDAQKNGTPDDVAAAKMILATAQFGRNQGDDREQAAITLKDIANDQSLLAATRSSAYSYMANWLFIYGSYDLMKQYVFNTSPYKEYLEEQKGDVIEATVYLLTLANNLQENVFNNYESAGLLAYKLRAKGIDPTNTDQQAVANRALTYITTGDKLLEDSLSTDFYAKNPGTKLFIYSVKAISLAAIQPFFSTISNMNVDDAFQTALAAIEPAKDSLPAQYTANNVRLEYAMWLSQLGGPSMAVKVKDIVKPISVSESAPFNSYIQAVRNRTSKSYAKRGVIRVAGLSSDFKAYAIAQGWQDADFASK